MSIASYSTTLGKIYWDGLRAVSIVCKLKWKLLY